MFDAHSADTREREEVIGTGQRCRAWLIGACTIVLVLLLPHVASAQSSAFGFGAGPFITLTWNPSPDGAAVGYIVYVGTSPKTYTQSYDVGSHTSFVYPFAKLNQRYHFAVASYDAARQVGSPSDEVSGTGRLVPPTEYLPYLATALSTVQSDGSTAASIQMSGCRLTTPCRATTLTTRPGMVNALASSPNGVVWFIENSKRLYAIGGNARESVPAITADRPELRLAGVAIAANFNETRWIFLQEIETLPDGTRELTIARYRELSNTLGDRAAMVTGVRLPKQGDAPFTVDDNGRIYVAVPAQDDSTEAYGGNVLAFEADGSALRDGRAMSPILSRGFRKPTGLLWDPVTGDLWLAGIDERGRSVIARTPARGSVTGEWPAIPISVPLVATRAAGAQRPSLASASSDQVLVLNAGGGRVARINHNPQAMEVILETGAPVSAVASGPGGLLYLVTQPSASATTNSIVVLRPE